MPQLTPPLAVAQLLLCAKLDAPGPVIVIALIETPSPPPEICNVCATLLDPGACSPKVRLGGLTKIVAFDVEPEDEPLELPEPLDAPPELLDAPPELLAAPEEVDPDDDPEELDDPDELDDDADDESATRTNCAVSA